LPNNYYEKKPGQLSLDLIYIDPGNSFTKSDIIEKETILKNVFGDYYNSNDAIKKLLEYESLPGLKSSRYYYENGQIKKEQISIYNGNWVDFILKCWDESGNEINHEN